MKTYKKWMGGLLFGAAIFAAAGGGNNADGIPGNMHGLIAGAFSSCKIVFAPIDKFFLEPLSYQV